jgi:hypothetical protein
VRAVDVSRVRSGYAFRLVGHPDDLDAAREELREVIPNVGRMFDERRGLWYVRGWYRDQLEAMFPGFDRLALAADEQLTLQAIA